MTGKMLWYRSTAAAGVALAAMLLVTAEMERPEPPGAPEDAVEEALPGVEPAGDPAAEGIKVHGHWTIEVREPDGKLVERREFENALLPEGAALLARALALEIGISGWEVFLSDHSLPACQVEPFLLRHLGCRIVESHYSEPAGANTYRSLVRSAETDPPVFVLSGQAAATRNGQISVVSTFAHRFGGDSHFTSTSIDPIPLLAGQLVLVTVRISFS